MPGPRLVLVRGLAREAGHWHGFDQALRERIPGATVEFHDLLGNGARWRETCPVVPGELAADLRRRVLSSDRRPPMLVAISLGAMVCLDWLQRWPADPVPGLVAINTSVGGLSQPWARMRIPAMGRTLESLVRRDPVARELAILRLTSQEHGDDLALAREHAAIHHQRPIRRSNVLRQMLNAATIRFAGGRDSGSHGRAPVLVLNSAGDRMVDPRCSAALARSLEAPLFVHPSAGHDLSLDDPAWCADRISSWVAVTNL